MTMNQNDRQWIDGKFKDVHSKIEKLMDHYEGRIRSLEDWKLVFVAKFTVYSAIAIFLGSTIAQVAMTLLLNKFG